MKHFAYDNSQIVIINCFNGHEIFLDIQRKLGNNFYTEEMGYELSDRTNDDAHYIGTENEFSFFRKRREGTFARLLYFKAPNSIHSAASDSIYFTSDKEHPLASLDLTSLILPKTVSENALSVEIQYGASFNSFDLGPTLEILSSSYAPESFLIQPEINRVRLPESDVLISIKRPLSQTVFYN